MNQIKQLTNAYLYARISVEDKENHSVENQISLIEDYARKNNFKIIETFIDDGYSGGSINRPAFNKMLNKAKLGIASTIIVKDLSRMARNYLEMGNLIENVFPKYNIRLISINDNVDSLNGIDDFVVIKNFMNAYYLKELSRKCKKHYLRKAKTHKLSRATNGLYGYRYKENTKELELDPVTSKIVEYIFDEYIKGKSMGGIAKDLTEKKVYTPGYYRYLTTGDFNKIYSSLKDEEKYNWKHSMVSIILHRKEYIGVAVNYKYIKINNKRTLQDEEDVININNAYPKIISKKVFEDAKNRYKDNTGFKSNDTPHLKKILFNSDNKALIYNETYNKKPSYSTRDMKHHIAAEDLHHVILSDIKNIINNLPKNKNNMAVLLKKIVHSNEKEVLEKLDNEKNLIINQISELFENQLNNKITQEQYQEQLLLLNDKLSARELFIDNASRENELTEEYKIKQFMRLIESEGNETHLELIYHVIDKVLINFISKKEYDINIKYKYINN